MGRNTVPSIWRPEGRGTGMLALAVREEKSPFSEADEMFSGLKSYLGSAKAMDMNHGDLERYLVHEGQELLRRLFQAHLNERGPGEAYGEVCDEHGAVRPYARLQERELETVFGTVNVERLGYGAPGLESLHPMDASLNIPEERYSHEVRRRLAVEAAKGSFEEAVSAIESNTGASVPKRQAEELVKRAAQDFEAFYENRRATSLGQAPGSEILVLSCDGKGVVMRREDLREATRKKAEAGTHKLQTRLCKGEKRNAKRMATVGAVYTVAAYPREPEDILHDDKREKPVRPRPEHKRVMASLERTPEEVIRELFDDALHRDLERTRKWVALVDGDATQLRLIEQEAKCHMVEITTVVDFIHVMEYVWKAGAAFHAEGSRELEVWVQERLLEILRGHASRVAGGMRRSATLRAFEPKQRKPVEACAKYLINHAQYLRYDTYLARGYPIATGVIEGACRHLVKDRMDLTGARWSLTGAEAVLRLRALRSSGDFEEYWRFHEAQEQERNHAALYKDGVVPDVKLPKTKANSGPRFRLVK